MLATRQLPSRGSPSSLEGSRAAVRRTCSPLLYSASSRSDVGCNHVRRRTRHDVLASCSSKEDLLEREQEEALRNRGEDETAAAPSTSSRNGSTSSSNSNSNGVSSYQDTPLPATTTEIAATQQSWTENLRQYSWLAFWITSAVAFGAGIWIIEGPTKGKEFFAGYLLEQCLSLDNLFVFQLVFSYFKTPESGQASVLSYGITTAAVLRAILILAGVQLVQQWKPVLVLFAAILIFSSYKLLTEDESADGEEEALQQNAVLKVCKRFIRTTDSYDGDKFFTVLADGTRSATPLLLALAVVELSDVVFALDSIPAVFGVTLDPFIVYTSNMFAILSLRAVFSFASTAMTQARYLDKAVAVVLGFIGVKLLLEFGHVDIPTDLSLLFVALVLGAGGLASYLLPQTGIEKER